MIKCRTWIQVLRYTVDGHYHAHYDTETHEHPEIPCCHQKPVIDPSKLGAKRCKLCRWVIGISQRTIQDWSLPWEVPVYQIVTMTSSTVRRLTLKEAVTDTFPLTLPNEICSIICSIISLAKRRSEIESFHNTFLPTSVYCFIGTLQFYFI